MSGRSLMEVQDEITSRLSSAVLCCKQRRLYSVLETWHKEETEAGMSFQQWFLRGDTESLFSQEICTVCYLWHTRGDRAYCSMCSTNTPAYQAYFGNCTMTSLREGGRRWWHRHQHLIKLPAGVVFGSTSKYTLCPYQRRYHRKRTDASVSLHNRASLSLGCEDTSSRHTFRFQHRSFKISWSTDIWMSPPKTPANLFLQASLTSTSPHVTLKCFTGGCQVLSHPLKDPKSHIRALLSHICH